MDAFWVLVFLFNGGQTRTPIGLHVLRRLMLKSRIKEKFGVFGLKLPPFFLDTAFSKKNGLLPFFEGRENNGPFLERNIVLEFHKEMIMWISAKTFKR